MILISHRGNFDGKDEELENSPEYVLEALDYGYDVEVDVRYIDGHYYLGHDKPEYMGEIVLNDLYKDVLWCHAKDGPTLRQLMKDGFHCFFNDMDVYTLTSKGFIWHYDGFESRYVLDKNGKLIGYCNDNVSVLK